MLENTSALLELNKLKKYFPVKRGVNLKALEDVSLKIYEGEKFGVVGESGCGKSTLGRVILQLYRQTSGACVYHGKSIEEVAPKYIGKEIDKLLEYQKKADEYYKKAVELDKKIAEMDEKIEQLSDHGTKQEVAKRRKLSQEREKLAFQSKEHKKDASRQLREGSRTVGSLILSAKLPEIQQLYKQAYNATVRAGEYVKEYNKYHAEYHEYLTKGENAPQDVMDKMRAASENTRKYRDEALTCKAKALSMRRQDNHRTLP